MARYEFSFVVTDVELSHEERARVGRAIALAGAMELGSALPPEAVSARVLNSERLIRHWCGIPAVLEVVEVAANNAHPDPPPWATDEG